MPSKKSVVPILILPFLLFLLAWMVQAAEQAKPPVTLILKGSPMGAVKFEHKLHVERVAGKCDTCHHASKPEKPATAAQQACRDCHTKPSQPGMKTATQAAFHNPMAKSGTCIDCHLKSNAAGKAAPVTCGKCHIKANG
ncbi:MAG: cytochrome c3 family protein [Acidobacteria bacterium]|nr:cytochrome c3 family protein [Acidobacteriota bacterium]